MVAETLDRGVVGLCTTDKRSILVGREKCISDSQRQSMTSPIASQQIGTRNDDFPGTDVASVCVGQSMVIAARRHGPVHERRAADSEHETLSGVHSLCSDIYIPT